MPFPHNFSHFSGSGDKSYIVFFAEELGKISLKISGGGGGVGAGVNEGHHTTPALTRIGSCMTFRTSLYKLTNRSLRDFPLR